MLRQGVGGSGAVLQLAERPLVDNVRVAGVVEQTRGDPRLCFVSICCLHGTAKATHLKHEPSTQVDAAN